MTENETISPWRREQLENPDCWVIRNKTTGEIIMETSNRRAVEALNTAKYEAVPLLLYLEQLHEKAKRSLKPRDETTSGS